MAEQAERNAAAERMATASIALGIGVVVLGVALVALSVVTGGLPGAPGLGWLGAVLSGALLALLGFGLTVRGVHLNATLDTLANLRLLQEETHRARTQAAVHAHAKREPMPELRPLAQAEPAPAMAKPLAKVATMTPAKVQASATVSQMPAPARRPVQSEQRASKAAPIKGKPFTPHPIFMAKPPK